MPFDVRVLSYDDKGKRKPVKGALVTGGAGPTDAQGRTKVTLTRPDPDPRHPLEGHPLQRGRRLRRGGLPLRRTPSMGRAGTAVAIALLTAALAAAGCGLGPGEELGEVSLTVTRDYGAEPVLESRADEVTESDTVMRVLDRNAEISTRFGGGFVQSIEGLEGEEGAGGPHDWFFYVNGVESTVGAADYPLHGGEAIWWDYRDWGTAKRVPAVVGSWPQPFLDGYDGGAARSRSSAAAIARRARRVRRQAGGGRGVSLVGGRSRRARSGSWSAPGARSPRTRPPRRSRTGRRRAASSPTSAAPGSTGTTPCALRGLDEAGDARRAASAPAPAWSPRPGATTRRRPGS